MPQEVWFYSKYSKSRQARRKRSNAYLSIRKAPSEIRLRYAAVAADPKFAPGFNITQLQADLKAVAH